MNLHTSAKAARMFALGLAVAAVLAGCAGNNATTNPGNQGYGAPASSPSTSAPATSAAPLDLKTSTSSLGPIVVDGNRMSLYVFTNDTKGTTASACTGDCLVKWPPALAAGATPKLDGVTGTVATIKTPENKEQLTLNGMPLYYFFQDAKPGDISGQGVGGVWYLASPDGVMIK